MLCVFINILLVMADSPLLFAPAQSDSHGQVELKQRILDGYFIAAQHQFDGQFVKIIFQIGEQDHQVDQLIQQHSLRILHSKQKANIRLLEHLIAHEKYQHIARMFLLNLIELKTKIYYQPLLLYVLRELPKLLSFIRKDQQEFIHAIVTFLSLNMRSFDRVVRITSLQTLKELGGMVQRERGEWERVMRRVVPMMIEKELLVKEVSYIKGLFLQMLEDEFHQVRILTIHCLGIFRNYMKPEDLKQIIIYMLNDEHELVREEALQTAKSLKDMPLAKEDLSTLLMCLREKRTNLRRLVYENLSLIRLNDISLIHLILEKVLMALQNYRSDKKHIYRALYELGRKYHAQIGKIFPNLGLNEVEEPNCKNISYKAKMVLCHVWWKKKSFVFEAIRLPSYFTKHMLYISDVEAYLFESTANMQEETESSVDYDQLKGNFHHLVRFIECEEDISQEFHKTLLEVAREMIIGHTQTPTLLQKLTNLSINFNLGKEEVALKDKLQGIIEEPMRNSDQILAVVMSTIKNRESFEEKNAFVAYNKCTVSRLEPNLIVSSKCSEFIERVYLKCWKHSIIGKQRRIEYKRVSELELLNENEVSYFWRAQLAKYNQIQCVLVSFSNEEKVLDNFDLQQK